MTGVTADGTERGANADRETAGMTRGRTLVAFGLIALLFGGAFPAVRVGVADVPPLLFAAGRYYLSGALLLVFAVLTGRQWRPATRADRAAVAAGGTLFIGGTGLNFLGLQYTTSGAGATVFAMVPVLTVVASWILLPTERATGWNALGVLVGFAGVAVVVNAGPVGTDAAMLGNVLVLGAATSVAFGTVLVRRARPAMSVVPLTGWAMLVGATVQFLLALATGESVASVTPTVEALLALVYLAVFAGAVAFVVYFRLLAVIGPLHTNVMAYLVPVVALVVGWALLDEPVAASSLAGLAVILAGFLVLEEQEIVAELAKYRGAAR